MKTETASNAPPFERRVCSLIALSLVQLTSILDLRSYPSLLRRFSIKRDLKIVKISADREI
jgi:hypothetical protein